MAIDFYKIRAVTCVVVGRTFTVNFTIELLVVKLILFLKKTGKMVRQFLWVLLTFKMIMLRGSCAKLKLRSQSKVFAKFGKNLTVDKGSGLKFFKPGYKNNSWAFSSSHVDYLLKCYARSISPASLLGLVCSLCSSDCRVKMHHVRHLKDINSRKSLTNKLMMRKKRKQISLCRFCHLNLHHKK